MLGRFNLFWIGAGGFLTLFCVNEIIAYHQSLTPLWLGGPLSYAGMVVGALFGLSVSAFLGVEPRPGEHGEPPATGPSDESDESDEGDEADESDEKPADAAVKA